MSLRAIVEIVIHLESFRNIDLFFQGIYYTRFRLHSKKNNGEISVGGAVSGSAATTQG